MEQSTEAFFNEFRQEMLAGAEANSSFQLASFMETIANELIETGFVEGFEFCHYRAQRGMRVDGYWFDDEGGLDLFIADFESRTVLGSLTRTEIDAAFRRVFTFFQNAVEKELYKELEVTAPEYGLARQLLDRFGFIRRINFVLLSERALSDRVQSLDDDTVCGISASYHIWDMSRLNRQRNARGAKEALDLDLIEMFGRGISCLPANLSSDSYSSYLIVMPSEVLADLYGRFGARLLEQNVRSFLQARGKVNQGIRSTIMNEPSMFFAYNNGITATAQTIKTQQTTDGLKIVRINDLQIVNGGQTTASLFHTRRRDKASLENIFVQMKLSVIDAEEAELVVPRISEYANTQNRVNAADFFSNHPFHIRMQDFSRRILAPAAQGAQRETRWFYERARGQYADAQSKLTPGEQRQFKAMHPKAQMFTKTDLAKFENVWDEHPRWVNLGAQKNFAKYASRIGKEWTSGSDKFNEFYFKRAIARAIIFRATERLVSNQSWYNGGYRANIVAYSIAAINELVKKHEMAINFMQVWNEQAVPEVLLNALGKASSFVNHDLVQPPQGISNISEWAKRENCWTRISGQLADLEAQIPQDFFDALVQVSEQKEEQKSARKTQKIDNGINDQKRVFDIGAETWGLILKEGAPKKLFSPKEIAVLQVAAQIPVRIPSEKQCAVLIVCLEKAQLEGIVQNETRQA